MSRPGLLLRSPRSASSRSSPLAASGAQAATGANDPVFTQGLQWGLEHIGAPQAWATSRGDGRHDRHHRLRHRPRPRGPRRQGRRLHQLRRHRRRRPAVQGLGPGRQRPRHPRRRHRGRHHRQPPRASPASPPTPSSSWSGSSPTPATATALLGLRHLRTTWPPASAGPPTTAPTSSTCRSAAAPCQGALGCAFCDAIDYAWSKGVISVIAAGNDSLLPGRLRRRARHHRHRHHPRRRTGLVLQRVRRHPAERPLARVRPGGEGESDPADCATGGTPKGVLSTYWITGHQNEYACLAGTSMAAPHVSGVLALLLAQGRTPQAAVDRLLGTARDLGAPGRDAAFGVGLIDAAEGGRPGPRPPPRPRWRRPRRRPVRPRPPARRPAPHPGTAPPSSDTSAAGRHPARDRAGGSAHDPDDDDPPAPLVATAVLLVLGTGATTAAAAWRLRRLGAL